MVNKDLGMVTAYAYAVSKGYTGTEEEFAALMADYAAVGQRAEAAATAAAASATAASGSASDSAASATAAEGFAGNASTSAGNASQAAQNASQSATAASGSATSAAGSATAAAGSATTAGNKATEAAQSATAAAGSATTAGASATAAQTAQTAAETAKTAAETAQAAAESAAQTLVIDPTLTQANQAAEAKATGDAISLVKSQLAALMEVPIVNGVGHYTSNGALATATNSSRASSEPRRCHANENILFIIYPGYSAYLYTCKNNTWTGSSALSAGNYIIDLQDNDQFCVTVASTAAIPADKVTAKLLLYSLEEVDYLAKNYEVHRSILFESSDFVQGSVYNGTLNPNESTCISQRTIQTIPEINNGVIVFSVVGGSGVWQYRVSFYNADGSFLQQLGYSANTVISIPSAAKFYRVSLKHSVNGSSENITPAILQNNTLYSSIPGDAGKIIGMMENSDGSPFFRTSDIEFIEGKFYDINAHRLNDEVGYSYVKLNVSPFRGGYISGQTSVAPNSRYGIGFTDKYDAFISGHNSTNTGHYEYAYNLKVPDNAVYMYLSRRNASADQWRDPVYPWDQALINAFTSVPDASSINNDVVNDKLSNARHVKSSDRTPLTLLHFSDLHADTGSLFRITEYAKRYGQNVDDMICTGDMVAGSAEQIASWWDADVLTCIGNHDSASYSGGTYDWTALSMADRDAYYIAPFESGWGIVHTSGTSYYYKDYTAQHVRMIVLDAMLYVGTPGAEATAQTEWLANLLSDAITNNLHVLIAIHAPHGGATAKVCSFSKYGQGVMPTLADCNTPQTVIDAVATAITNGLHFIGYIVGHTHQDNMWDATGDGTQMMYCITCAASTQTAQWQNSDMHRDEQHDAFNLVTIDTSNTLVKIVRGGGADIDDHMRSRKAICFNYSTGTVVGEVL